MKWTEDLPKKSGYYWFAECYEDTQRIIWVDCQNDIVSTFDMNCYDEICVFNEDNGYWFSSQPIPVFGWENT